MVHGFRQDLRLVDDVDSVQALINSSGWSVMGLSDCAVAWQTITKRGAKVLHNQPFQVHLAKHTLQQLDNLLQSPLKSWGAASLSPAELSAIRTAGVRCPPSAGTLGMTVASLAGCAGALNRLPSMSSWCLSMYARLDEAACKLLAPSSRSPEAVQAWRRSIVCSEDVFEHATALVHMLVMNGTWSPALLQAYADCLSLKLQACSRLHSAAKQAPSLAKGAHALCAARATDALSAQEWKQLAGLFLDEDAALNTHAEGGGAEAGTPPPLVLRQSSIAGHSS